MGEIGPKETAYDEHISPLMAKIIKLCKEHKINAFAHFRLDYNEATDETLCCTTALPIADDDPEGKNQIDRLRVEVTRVSPGLIAMTIRGADDA